MHSTLNEYEFVDAFETESRRDQFSREARRALFSWYSEMEADTGSAIEFDMIAICCEWGEHDVDSLLADYGDRLDLDEYEDSSAPDTRDQMAADLAQILNDETTIIPLSNGWLVMHF
jgi:hypothetical protein